MLEADFYQLRNEFEYLISHLSLAEIFGNQDLFFQIERIKQILEINDEEEWDDEVDTAL